MKIDSAIKNFLEKYDEEAMSSIDNLSKDIGLKHHRLSLPLFNIKECFDIFISCLDVYSNYKIENANNDKAVQQYLILEKVNSIIDSNLFKKKNILYSDLPVFIESYINGINSLLEKVESTKSNMINADVHYEYIGDVNEFTDKFMEKMNKSFYESMDKILTASGYKTNKSLMNKKVCVQKPQFL